MTMNKQQAVISILHQSKFRTRVGSQNISIPCPLAAYSPLHKSKVDSRPSMGIKVTEGAVLVHCFTCGFKSGQLSYLYSRLAKHDSYWIPALEATRAMEAQFLSEGLSMLNTLGYMREKEKAQEPLDESLYEPYANKFAPYFQRRGISLETGKRWGVGVDVERKRAVIPVRDQEGRLWGAVGRSYVEERPKYLNYWEMKKGQHLLGAQLIKTASTTVIVEGSIDAMICDQAIREAGFQEEYNVVSILGSSLSEVQAQKIINNSLEVIIALDADEAGQRGTQSAVKLLGSRIMTKVASLQSVGQNDFGGCSIDQIGFVLEGARLI